MVKSPMRYVKRVVALCLLASSSGCFTLVATHGILWERPPVQHSLRVEAVTLARGPSGKLEPHLRAQLDGGRELHLVACSRSDKGADMRARFDEKGELKWVSADDGRFREVDGPLPASSVPLVVLPLGVWHEDPVVAPGDLVRRASLEDGTLSKPEPLTERDLTEAHIVVIARGDESLSVSANWLDVGVIEPEPTRGRTSDLFVLGADVASVVSVTVERRNGKLVWELLASSTTSTSRLRLDSTVDGTHERVAFEGDLPRPLVPIAVVQRLENAKLGLGVQRVAENASIARELSPFTAKDEREAAVLELNYDEKRGSWCARFRAPANARLTDVEGWNSVVTPKESSPVNLGEVVELIVLLPFAVVFDAATLPIQAIVFSIWPPFI